MISLNANQLEKIDLIDKLFGALSIDQLREISESEQIIAILKGTGQNTGILSRLIQEHDTYAMDMMNLKSEMMVLRGDLSLLTKLVLKPYDYNSANDAQTLKSRAGIY